MLSMLACFMTSCEKNDELAVLSDSLGATKISQPFMERNDSIEVDSLKIVEVKRSVLYNLPEPESDPNFESEEDVENPKPPKENMEPEPDPELVGGNGIEPDKEIEDIDVTVNPPNTDSLDVEEEAPAIYIHVNWGCNGNTNIIQLECELSHDHPAFEGISYEWTSAVPFSNTITCTHYAVLYYVGEGPDLFYNVNLTLTTESGVESLPFCFQIIDNEMVNCGNSSMMSQSCVSSPMVLNNNVISGLELAGKGGTSACFLFPVFADWDKADN